MPTRKTDIVRRSLFGPGVADVDDSATRPVAAATSRSSSAASGRAAAGQPPEQAQDIDGQHPRRLERTAVTVPTDLLMRVKDAVAVLNGWPHQYTMTRFVEEAFAAQLERLKVDHNGGREFPVTNRRIRTGRPPGT